MRVDKILSAAVLIKPEVSQRKKKGMYTVVYSGVLCCVIEGVRIQEAKYVESWPNTTSAWFGWSRFDIPVDRYGRVHSLLLCTIVLWGLLPATRLAGREILIEQNIKKRTGPALCVLCGQNYDSLYICTVG
jgi:hypothetical protein